MKDYQYRRFLVLRRKFNEYVEFFPCVDDRIVPVYNCDLDKFKKDSNVKYILVCDNPGEQEKHFHRYLIGKAGQFARNFFFNSGLVENFDEQVIVLNKTFLHTKSTADLKVFLKDISLKEKFEQSQKFMARFAFDLHLIFGCEMWIIGCSEVRPKGIFAQFRESLCEFYLGENSLKNKLFCFKHFSYGNFSRDLNNEELESINQKLVAIGERMRLKILSW